MFLYILAGLLTIGACLYIVIYAAKGKDPFEGEQLVKKR